MRNAAFVPLVMQLARQAPGVTKVQTLAEAGETTYPFGFAVSTAKSESRWQAMQKLADKESHDHPAADVEGLPAAWDDTEIKSGDAWLAALIGRARWPQISQIVCWSQLPDAGAEGVTVYFHNGARSFFRRVS